MRYAHRARIAMMRRWCKMAERSESPTRDRGLLLALALSALACVWPIWAADMLPIVDLPQHLATVRILRDLHTPGWNLAAYYQLELARTQYLGWYAMAVLLSQLVTIETAAKLLLSLYIFAIPFSVLSFLRAHRRDPTWAILAAPLALNDSLWMGFCNYISAIPVMFFWLAQLQRQLDAPSRRRGLGLLGLPVIVYFLHAQALLHGVLLAVATVAVHRNGLRTRAGLRALAHVLPALGLFALWALGSTILASQAGWATTRAGHNEPTSALLYLPWPLRFSRLPDALTGLYFDGADQHILLGLACLALLGVLLAWLERRRHPDAPPLPQPGLPELAFALTLLLYFAVPTRYKWIYAINTRTVPIAALLLLAVLARARVPRQSLLLVPGVVIALALGALHAERFALFSLEAQPARALLAHAPMGSRGVGILWNPTSVVVNNAPFLHFAQYGVLDRGGMADFSFANYPQSPVTFVPPGPPNLPIRFEKHPERFTMRNNGFWYDWFLVRDFGPQVAVPEFVDAPNEVTRVQRIGDWQLFRRRVSP